MGGVNYIPTAHDKFSVWQNVFYNRVTEKLSSFKIEESKLKDLTAAKSKYELAFQRASNPDSANRADRVERDEREADYKTAIRAFVNENIRYNSNISDYDRQYLGLTIADHTPTPAAVPHTHPVLRIDFSEPQQHTIHIRDEKLDSKQKPEGVKECEIWYKIASEQPTHDSELHYAGSATKSTFSIDFGAEEQGNKVWYKGRWVNTRGQHGTWSVYTSAIIA
ncbi:MAG: hypothetical protein LBR75_03910 [Prevotellaceae bacterium]|jgi:hypothetical protein|nr:hypothetical protein [Prevotellaceae bacterium]